MNREISSGLEPVFLSRLPLIKRLVASNGSQKSVSVVRSGFSVGCRVRFKKRVAVCPLLSTEQRFGNSHTCLDSRLFLPMSIIHNRIPIESTPEFQNCMNASDFQAFAEGEEIYAYHHLEKAKASLQKAQVEKEYLQECLLELADSIGDKEREVETAEKAVNDAEKAHQRAIKQFQTADEKVEHAGRAFDAIETV